MPTTPQPRILIIEDDPPIRATLIDLLEFNDFTVLQAENGVAGVAAARRERPDLIITDISMPGLNGFEVIQALQADEQTRAIPIVIISATVEPEKARQGMALGARHFIMKPFSEDEILATLRTCLEKKPS